MTAEQMKLVAAVRKHAEANYNDDGWDFLVECWDDNQIAEVIGNCVTVEQAIKAVGTIVGIMDDQRRDITAEIF